MRLLTAGAALAGALLAGGVPTVALIAEDPPASEKADRGDGSPAHAGRQGGHGNPHGPDHADNMKKYARQHAEAMQTWGPCMENLDSTGEQEPSRAEKLRECGPKPTPPGHRGNEHAGHKSWHKFHPGSPSQARPGRR